MELRSRKTFILRISKRIAPFIILMGVVLILYGYRDKLFTSDLTKENSPYVLMGVFYVIVGVAFFLFRYIETGLSPIFPFTSSSHSSSTYLERRVEKEISKLKKQVSDTLLNNENKGIDPVKIDELIQEKINFNVENSLKNYFETKYADNSIKIKQSKILEHQTNELQIGVNNQIGKLSRSGTINLIIGLLTTLTAIWILASLVLSVKDIHFESTKDFLIYLIPRLSLALFIEVFSFFFLRLYKRNLEDVKYFHNERTNIDSKIIALKSALLFGKDELLTEIIKNFSTVERNFILKKDESTVNLERIKLDTQQEIDYITKISNIIEKVQK